MFYKLFLMSGSLTLDLVVIEIVSFPLLIPLPIASYQPDRRRNGPLGFEPQTLSSLALAYHVSSLVLPIKVSGTDAARFFCTIGHAFPFSAVVNIDTEVQKYLFCYLGTRDHFRRRKFS